MKLTAYELACGRVQRDTDVHGHTVTLLREHGVYHVRKSSPSCGTHAWIATETLRAARSHFAWMRRAVLLPPESVSAGFPRRVW